MRLLICRSNNLKQGAQKFLGPLACRSGWLPNLLSVFCHCFCDLRLHGVKVERCPLLHRRIIDSSHGQLPYFLLHKHKAPELIHEPVEIHVTSPVSVLRRKTHPLEGIETQVGKDRHVWMVLGTEPASGLSNELVLEVVDSHSCKVGFREVEDFAACRW